MPKFTATVSLSYTYTDIIADSLGEAIREAKRRAKGEVREQIELGIQGELNFQTVDVDISELERKKR